MARAPFLLREHAPKQDWPTQTTHIRKSVRHEVLCGLDDSENRTQNHDHVRPAGQTPAVPIFEKEKGNRKRDCKDKKHAGMIDGSVSSKWGGIS